MFLSADSGFYQGKGDDRRLHDELAAEMRKQIAEIVADFDSPVSAALRKQIAEIVPAIDGSWRSHRRDQAEEE